MPHPAILDVRDRLSGLDQQVLDGRISVSDAIKRYAYAAKDSLGMSHLASAVPHEAVDEELFIPFIVTTLREDRDGDVVVPMGIETGNFELNAVWFFGHQQHPIPIGKGVKDGKLSFSKAERLAKAGCWFDPRDPDSVMIYHKVKDGFLNATSIAFVPLQARRRDREEEKGIFDRAHPHTQPMQPPGWLFERVDLTEISIVGVPSNAGAIRDIYDSEKSHMSPRLQKAWLPYCAKSFGRSFSGWCPSGTVKCPDGTCQSVTKVHGRPTSEEELPEVPSWDVIVDGKAWGKVDAADEVEAIETAKWQIDQVRRKQMPKDYTEEEFRARFPKPKVEVQGPYSKGGRQVAKEPDDEDEVDTDLYAPREKWNKSLSSAFDQMPELQLEDGGKVGAVTTHRVSAKYIGCQIKDLHQSQTMVPSPRIGSFLAGLQHVLKDFRVIEVRNLSDRSEQPPVYEAIQLKSDLRGTFLVQGMMFVEHVSPRGKRPGPAVVQKGPGQITKGKDTQTGLDYSRVWIEDRTQSGQSPKNYVVVVDGQVVARGFQSKRDALARAQQEQAKIDAVGKGAGPHNNYGRGVGDKRVVVKLSPEWGGINVKVLTRSQDAGLNQSIIDGAWQWAKANNYLKGEAFALSGEFLQRTAETWDDVFLEAGNRKTMQRTLELFNAKGLGFANRGVILTGPPGTGKTLSSRVFRNQAKGTFIWVSARDFYHSNGSAGGFAMAFEMAKELAPSVLVFEDVDNWLTEKSIDLLKTEMDGMARSKGVLTILTTNFPEQLPQALIDRPGRFHDVLEFGLPDEIARKAMLRKWLPQVPQSHLDVAVERSAGYSGAHVYELAHFAKSLQEHDDLAPAAALDEAVRKVEEQRQLVARLQDHGAGYDRRRRRSAPGSVAKSDAPVVVKSHPAGEWPDHEVGKDRKPTGEAMRSTGLSRLEWLRAVEFILKNTTKKPLSSYTAADVSKIYASGATPQQGAVAIVATAKPGYEGPYKKQTCRCGGSCGKCGGKAMKGLGQIGKMDIPLPERAGRMELPPRDVNRIYSYCLQSVFGGDAKVEQLPEWSAWKNAVYEHYVKLRTADKRMEHRRALEQSYDALRNAAKRAGIQVAPKGYSQVMPDDGAKGLFGTSSASDRNGKKVVAGDHVTVTVAGKPVVRRVTKINGTSLQLEDENGQHYGNVRADQVTLMKSARRIVFKRYINIGDRVEYQGEGGEVISVDPYETMVVVRLDSGKKVSVSTNDLVKKSAPRIVSKYIIKAKLRIGGEYKVLDKNGKHIGTAYVLSDDLVEIFDPSGQGRVLKRTTIARAEAGAAAAGHRFITVKGIGKVSKYITHDGDTWTVHAESGKVLGRHSTKEDAERQLRAVEANKSVNKGPYGIGNEIKTALSRANVQYQSIVVSNQGYHVNGVSDHQDAIDAIQSVLSGGWTVRLDGSTIVVRPKKKQLAEQSGTAGGYTVPVDAVTSDTLPANSETVCTECGGSGECPDCDGAGVVGDAPCTMCGGSGECGLCGGSGMIAKSMRKKKSFHPANRLKNYLSATTKKVKKSDVDRAAANYSEMLRKFGENNMATDRAQIRYYELKEQYERETGSKYVKIGR